MWRSIGLPCNAGRRRVQHSNSCTWGNERGGGNSSSNLPHLIYVPISFQLYWDIDKRKMRVKDDWISDTHANKEKQKMKVKDNAVSKIHEKKKSKIVVIYNFLIFFVIYLFSPT